MAWLEAGSGSTVELIAQLVVGLVLATLVSLFELPAGSVRHKG